MTTEPMLSDDELAALAWRATQALPDAPAAWRRAAVALWATQAPPLADRLRRVLAVLRFDSLATPAMAAGMRSAGGEARHLLFSAEGRDVDLRITPQAAGQWQLAGQVLGPDDCGQVRLQPVGTDTPPREAALDDMGEFRLADVAAGPWRLSLALGDTLVELPAIDVGAAPG